MKNISKFDESVKFVPNGDDKDHFDEINHLEKYAKDEHAADDIGTEKLDESILIQNNDDGNNNNNNNGKKNMEANNEFTKYLTNIKDAFYESYKQMDKLLSRGKNERNKAR